MKLQFFPIVKQHILKVILSEKNLDMCHEKL